MKANQTQKDLKKNNLPKLKTRVKDTNDENANELTGLEMENRFTTRESRL